MRSPAEARAYLLKLRAILRTLGVSDANMEEGQLRCDVNISLRPIGQTRVGHQGRDQEPELVPRRAALAGVRDRAPGRSDPTRRAHRPGDARLARGARRDRLPSAPRKRRTTTATSRSRTCRRCSSSVPGWTSFAPRLPELPDARRARYMQSFALNAYDAEQLSTDARGCRPLRGHRWRGRGREEGGQPDPQRRGACPPDSSALSATDLAPRLAKLIATGRRGRPEQHGVAPGGPAGRTRAARIQQQVVEELGLAQVSDSARARSGGAVRDRGQSRRRRRLPRWQGRPRSTF